MALFLHGFSTQALYNESNHTKKTLLLLGCLYQKYNFLEIRQYRFAREKIEILMKLVNRLLTHKPKQKLLKKKNERLTEVIGEIKQGKIKRTFFFVMKCWPRALLAKLQLPQPRDRSSFPPQSNRLRVLRVWHYSIHICISYYHPLLSQDWYWHSRVPYNTLFRRTPSP